MSQSIYTHSIETHSVRAPAHVTLIALPIIARDSRTRDDDRSRCNRVSSRHDLSGGGGGKKKRKKNSPPTKEEQIKGRERSRGAEKCRLLNEHQP